jgi:hypothetical protein
VLVRSQADRIPGMGGGSGASDAPNDRSSTSAGRPGHRRIASAEHVGEGAADADALDKDQIDQLHAVTLQVSANCFELKKLCATVLIAAGTLVATFTNKHLDAALFASAVAIVGVFWAADAQSYYIQTKLRIRMKELQDRRVHRSGVLGGYDSSGVGMPVKDPPSRATLIWHSFINASMLYYLLIVGLVVVAWILYAIGIVH